MNLNLMPHYKYSAKDIFYILKTLWQIKSTLEVKAAKPLRDHLFLSGLDADTFVLLTFEYYNKENKPK